ncbi:MAG: hypothetical protein P1P85_05855 [Patescibacteria group bacterium]|nr:hypothetical protein [Patescibacteria group bacterium]
MRYILATHTGKGFYTHEDRMKMPTFKFSDGLAIIEGECDEWIKRVNGKEITEIEANNILKQKFDESKANEIAEKTKELKDLKNKDYDKSDITIR